MAGVLTGLRVLDLTWGVAGPMATMLLTDHGAEVTRIERPGGPPPIPWQHTREIVAELGYAEDAIESLLESGVAITLETAP